MSGFFAIYFKLKIFLLLYYYKKTIIDKLLSTTIVITNNNHHLYNPSLREPKVRGNP